MSISSNHLTLLVGAGRHAIKGHSVGETVAIDLKPLYLYESKKTSKKNVHFCVADACNLPFPRNAFSAVFCKDVLEHIPRSDLALEEMSRVTRTRGRLIIQIPTAESEYALSHNFRAYSRSIVGVEHKHVFKGLSLPTLMRISENRRVDAYGGLYWLMIAMTYRMLRLDSKATIDSTGRINLVEAGPFQRAVARMLHISAFTFAVLSSFVVSATLPRESGLGKIIFKSRRVVATKVRA